MLVKKRPSKANLHVNSHRVKNRAPKNALQSQRSFLTRKKTPFNFKGDFFVSFVPLNGILHVSFRLKGVFLAHFCTFRSRRSERSRRSADRTARSRRTRRSLTKFSDKKFESGLFARLFFLKRTFCWSIFQSGLFARLFFS